MAAGERTLSERELNRALLARQGLLERFRGGVPRTLERVGGLQAQYAPSMYVGLWSRMEGLERDDLTRTLERRTTVQATLMRATIHLVARPDYWPFALAVRAARRTMWLRAMRGSVSEEDMVEAAAIVRARLADRGATLQRKELEQLVGKQRATYVGLWVDLVRVPPSGTWERRRADLFALAEDWIGPPPSGAAEDPPAARAGPRPSPLAAPPPAGTRRGPPEVDHLVRRYLAGFGPASLADVVSYTGLPRAAIAATLEGLRLRRFRSAAGDELLDVPRGPLPDPETPAPVRFLPTWDATLLVHARRTGVLPERHRAKIFHVKNPHSLPTFLVDGAVAGTWRYRDGRIELDPFDPLDAAGAARWTRKPTASPPFTMTTRRWSDRFLDEMRETGDRPPTPRSPRSSRAARSARSTRS